jgi:CheY-like chemotaxis protein
MAAGTSDKRHVRSGVSGVESGSGTFRAARPAEPARRAESAPKTCRILLVEDNPDVRELLAFILESEGYEVDAVGAADDGLALLHTTAYNLILTDYALPRHTGRWLLEQAAAAGFLQNTHAVIVTAHPSVPDSCGWPVVRKPLDVDLFLQTLRSILG